MSNSIIKIGLDKRDKMIYAARVKTDKTRFEIKALIRLNSEFPLKHDLIEDGDLHFAIPDSQAMLKQIRISPESQYSTHEQAKFEMIQSVLEDESVFSFESEETSQANNIIGAIFRKERSDKLIASYNANNFDKNRIKKFRVRSLALGKGYLNFCHPETGELACIADFCKEVVSICLIYQKKILNVASIDLQKFDFLNENDIDKITMEFKTILNFKLSSIFDKGITVPLSSLMIIGGNEQLVNKFSDYFKLKPFLPKINHGFFSNPKKLEQIPLHNYLIALGLSVD
ncbi:MAG: hypothetical protein DRP35_08915 [Candidatus Zixiibacteriota bacterium]|nr:MAG: hypothetical protein DRP35_08915 [candidate division Zixibacteria bacterium]